MRSTWALRVTGVGAGVLMVLGSLGLPGGPAGAAPGTPRGVQPRGQHVVITTDSAGIPHITAPTFFGLGYGEAWAFAGDNFCTLAQDFVTVNGERSRYFGPNGLSIDYSAGTVYTNLDSDLFWRSIKEDPQFERDLHLPPPLGPLPQLRQLYRGFVAGYNAYLASGRLHDPTCAGKPWVRPITLTDMWLRAVQILTEASSEQFIGDEVDATPPPPGSPALSTASAPSPSDLEPLASLGGRGATGPGTTGGSNGIGLGAQDTRSGDGMVLANPHFPWRGTERFWMAQLTVPGAYDVEGGTLEGFPLIGIGFNRNLAWTHTVSTDFRFTFYQLKLVPGHPTSYYLDGKPHAMGTETVTVNNGSGATTHTFYTTKWGRVLVVPQAGYQWTTTTAYAVDDATITDFRVVNEYLRMGQSTSVHQLLAVEEQYLGIPTFNTIAADDHGNALYADVGATPAVTRSLLRACLPPGTPTLVYDVAGVVTLDGSRTACEWEHEPGTPVPGIFNGAHLPHTIRRDYVENSNDSYWLANPSAPFRAYPSIIGKIDIQQNLRTRLGNEMIAARVAGTDGLGPPKFTIPTLQKMWESDRSELADLVLTSLVAACRKTPVVQATNGAEVNLTEACDVLSRYDKTGRLKASGGWLFSEWYARVPSGGFWADSFDPSKPLTTPSKLNTANPDVLRSLADAVQALQARGIPLDASYGQVQYYAAANGTKIPIPGCDTGCFNAIYAADGLGGPLQAGPYGEVHSGSSLVMTTRLAKSGPISQGILTYSQATDPTSPWYSNMTRLYSQHRWVQLAYTPAQLAAQPGNTTVTLRVR